MPRQHPPSTIALAYLGELRRMLGDAEVLVARRVLPVLRELTGDDARGLITRDAQQVMGQGWSERECEDDGGHVWTGGVCAYCPATLARTDASRDPAGRINKLMDRVSEAFFRRWGHDRLAKLARKYAERTSEHQRAQLARQINAQLGIDPVIGNAGLAARLKAATAENVALIKTVPQTFFDQIERRMVQGLRTGDRHETIAKNIGERFRVAQSRAKLIARDQTLKLYGELNAARQQDLGITRYVWRSANDQRVRDAHGEFDGNTYRWDDPPGDGSPEEGTHPGTAIQCRCWADPVLDDVV